jgi:CTP:molybdopterin cytidylyltransferase MocA
MGPVSEIKRNIASVILAAGKSTRMKAGTNKVSRNFYVCRCLSSLLAFKAFFVGPILV